MFITVFIDFINTFAKEYKLKLFLMVVLSVVSAGFEFLGLSFIYAFAILLSKNELHYNILGNCVISGSPKTALLLGLIVAFTYIFKDLFMIAYINFTNILIVNITNKIFERNYNIFMGQNYIVTRKIPESDKQRILGGSISTTMGEFVGGTLSLFSNLIIAFGILSYLFIKFKLTALTIGLFIFLIWLAENFYFKSRAKKYGKELHLTEREKQNFTLSTISAQKDVIIYNKKEEFTAEANKIQKKYSKSLGDMSTNRAMPTYFTEIGIMSTFILFVVLQLMSNPQGTTLGAGLAAVAAVILRIVPTINKTQNCLYAINSSKIEAQWFITTMKSLENTSNKVKSSDEKLPFNDKLSLKNINFYYDESTHALKNLNLDIKKGEFIGIIGASGSGKTTLFNLVCALFQPQSGTFSVDNCELNYDNIRMWQNNISILSQEFSLPFETIWQNVVFEPNASKRDIYDFEKIKTALKKAGILEELGDELNKSPKELSCGQRHRIALSRAFYYDREIIMLDEATSALDVETEDTITKTIESVKGSKTIIAIAHRIKTLKNCDRLVFMDKGQIIDTGTLEELCEKHESFRRLIKLSKF